MLFCLAHENRPVVESKGLVRPKPQLTNRHGPGPVRCAWHFAWVVQRIRQFRCTLRSFVTQDLLRWKFVKHFPKLQMKFLNLPEISYAVDCLYSQLPMSVAQTCVVTRGPRNVVIKPKDKSLTLGLPLKKFLILKSWPPLSCLISFCGKGV
jgi:hypothetical protein